MRKDIGAPGALASSPKSNLSHSHNNQKVLSWVGTRGVMA